MVLVNFPNGQVNRPSDLIKIENWWQNRAGQIPKIYEITGDFNNNHTVTIDSSLPVSNVNISGNTVTWSEGGTPKNAKVTSIVLDEGNNSIKISSANNPLVDWEFQY